MTVQSRTLREIDLNLLVVFRDIMQTQNISATARRLNMSQPAASNALARLRETLGDALLVRSGQGMTPTPLGLMIAQDIDEAMGLLQNALNRRASFDPTHDRRRFVIAMTDVGEVYFMPRLLAHCAQHAPQIRIAVSAASDAALRQGLQEGSIDLALGPYQDMAEGLMHLPLFRQHCVSLFRSSHPFARTPPTTLAQFRDARHVFIANAAGPYRDIQQRMEKAGLSRQAHDQVSSFPSAPFVAATSDCVATVPYKLAEQFAAPLGLHMLRPPLRLPTLDTHCFWHRRSDADPGLRWLRQTVTRLFAEV